MSESTTKVDADLQTNLKRAQKATQQGPHFFALLAKGGGEGRLIVSKRKIPDKQVAEAKKALGGATVVKGLCFGEGGQLVFETAKPPAPAWLVTVKKQAKEAGLSALKAAFRQGRDDESVAETTAEPPEDGAPAPETAPPETAPSPAAEWQRRVAGVTDRVKAATAARHPAARDMILGVSEAQTLFRRGDAGAAEARLAKVEAQLKPAPTAADPAAEYKARFAEWQGIIKQALTAKPPNAGDIAKLLAQATALGKPGGDPVQALDKLKECHALAKAVLAGGPAAKQPTADPAAEYKARFAEWQGIIKQALTAKPPNAGDIAKLLAQATALGKPGGDPVQALDKLKECHALAKAVLASGAAAKQPTADPAAEYKARFAEWQGIIKQALTAKPPNAGDIAKLLAQATALGKPGGDPAQALAKLTECHALAKAVLAGGAGVKQPTADPAAEYKARFAEWQGIIKQALTAKPPNAGDIAKLLAQATALSKPGGDPAQALAKLKECHALAAAVLAGSGQAPGGAEDGKPDTRVVAALDDWQSANETVDGQITKLQQALKATGEDELIQIAEYGLNGVTGNYKVRLMALAMELRRAGGAAAKGPASKALTIAAEFRQHLLTSAEVRVCDTNPFGVAVSIRDTLGGALSRLEGALKTFTAA